MAETLGPYELIERLAGGGMGEVFLAQRIGEAQKVVIKRVLPELADDEQFLAMFLEEARLGATLKHPNIARTIELGQDGNVWFLVMEHVAGPDFRRVLNAARLAGAPLPIPLCCRVACDVLAGLHAAHIAVSDDGKPLRIVHRDISPQNILVGLDGVSKVIDFGIARAANRAQRTQEGIIRGKLPYMSPEQALAGQLDARSDVYSLGIVLWQALTGRRLFDGDDQLELHARVRDPKVCCPSEVNERVSKELGRVCLKALAREPSERFQTADEAREALVQFAGSAEDLQRFLGGLPIPQPRRVTAAPTRTMRRPNSPSAVDAAKVACQLPPLQKQFFGREKERAALEQALSSGERLITLSGPPGVGKTRLLIEFLKHRPEERTFFLSLEGGHDADCLCTAFGRALKKELRSGATQSDTVLELAEELNRRGPVLIAIDHLDELVLSDSLGTIRDLLAAAPYATLVLTTRASTQLQGEKVLTIEALPPAEAFKLFCQRVSAERPGFTFSSEEAQAARAIAELAGGLPLALDLLAARARLLTPSKLLARLSTSGVLSLAGTGAKNLGAVLGAAIDALPQAERETLYQCAVFRGGFSLEAAEAVVKVDREPVLDRLDALHRRSLLSAGGDADALRFELSAPIRELGLDRLQASGAREAAFVRHADCYVTLGNAARSRLDGAEGTRALETLVLERDNLVWVLLRGLSEQLPDGFRRALDAAGVLDALLSRRGPGDAHLKMVTYLLGQAASRNVSHPSLPQLERSKAKLMSLSRARVS